MKSFSLMFIFITWTTILFAQQYVDLIKLDYARSAQSNFPGSEASTVLNEINGELLLPFVMNDKLTLLPGVNFESINADFDSNDASASFTSLTLKLGANFNYNSKWSSTFFLLPQVSSDFKKFGKNDFQLGGVALMKYAKSERFAYRFGLYANRERFGPLLVPLLGFYYLDRSKKLEAKVLLPLSADVNYSLMNNLRLGLRFKGQVKTYTMNRRSSDAPSAYLTKSAKDLYAYLQYGFKNGLNVQFSLGHSIGRSYLMYNEKVALSLPLTYFGDDRKPLNQSFSDSLLFKLAVLYRLKI